MCTNCHCHFQMEKERISNLVLQDNYLYTGHLSPFVTKLARATSYQVGLALVKCCVIY